MIKKIIEIYQLYKVGYKRHALDEFIVSYIKFDKRCERGQQLLEIFSRPVEAILFKGGIIVGWVELIAYKRGVVIPIWFWIIILPTLYLIQKLAEYYSGRYDQKKLKSWEKSVDWENRNISKWEQEKMNLLKKIHDKN